jgi:hypothetical protein
LIQGDIIKEVPFRKYDDNGQEEEYISDGLIVSNSCDIENDTQVLIAPFIPIDKLSLDMSALKNNSYYSLLYFPDSRYSDKVADLNLLSPYPRKLILDKIAVGKIIKIFSLNLIGYYLFISKITVHLLRTEDSNVQSQRN